MFYFSGQVSPVMGVGRMNVGRSRGLGVMLAGMLVAGSAAHASVGNGILRCMTVRQPVRVLADGLSAASARSLAPTRAAVFLSRAGDRCLRHGSVVIRG